MINLDTIDNDRHAAGYRPVLDRHDKARDALLAVLNSELGEFGLVLAEELGRPALAGVVKLMEGDGDVQHALDDAGDGHRFRQAIGVLVRLKMTELGWHTTGVKGILPNTNHFTKAERYSR